MEGISQIQTIQCHDSDVNCIDFGPKDRLATVSSDKLIRLFSWNTKRKAFVEDEKSPLRHHTFSVNEVRFSPQGTMLVTGSTDGTAVIWDLATCTVLCSFMQPSRLGVRCCRFSPDASKLVTSGDDDSACIWNLGTRSLIKTYRASEHTVFSSEFTPDDGSNLITTDANGDIRLWDINSNQHNKPVFIVEEAHDLGVLCCEFAPWNVQDNASLDKEFILATGGNDDCVKIWSVIVGLNTKIISRKKICGHHNSAVMCLRFSKDSKYLASSGGDKLACIYEVETGNVIQKMTPHDRYIGSCAFSQTGTFFATGSNDKSVAIFELEEYKSSRNNIQGTVHENRHRLTALAGREDAVLINTIPAHVGDINDVVFVNNQDFVTCSSDKCVKLWKNTADLDRIIEQRSYALYSMDFCKSRSLLLISGTDGQVAIWDTVSWTKLATVIAPAKAAIRTCTVSPNATYLLLAGDDDQAHIFSLLDYKHVKSLKGHEATVFFACFTHESSHILTGDNDGILFIWDWNKSNTNNQNSNTTTSSTSQKPEFSVDDTHDLGISCGDCMPYSENCQYSIVLTGGNDSLIKVWKVWVSGTKKSSAEHIKTLIGHGSSIMSIKWASNSRCFASSSGDKTTRLWDANTFDCIRVLEGHERYVGCGAFNFTGDLLVTGSNDRTFNVWRLSGSLVPGIDQQCGEITSAISSGAVGNWSCNEAQNNFKSEVPGGTEFPESEESKYLSKIPHDGQLVNTSEMPAMDNDIPEEFICPITQDIMNYPVLCSDGFVYEKAAIQEWLNSRKTTSPMTNLPMTSTHMELQTELKERIGELFKN